MTDDATPEPLTPDGWSFRDDRSAVLWLDGKPHRLRPPRMGEFRTIRADLHANTETILEATRALQARKLEIAEEVGAKRMTLADGQAELSKRSSELNDLAETTHWETLADVIARLCPIPLPDVENLPTWLVASASKSLAELASFWQSLPPHLGSPANVAVQEPLPER